MKFSNDFRAIHGDSEMSQALVDLLGTDQIMCVVDPYETLNADDVELAEYLLWERLQSKFNPNRSNSYIAHTVKTGPAVDFDGASPHLLQVGELQVVYSGWGVTAFYITKEVYDALMDQ